MKVVNILKNKLVQTGALLAVSGSAFADAAANTKAVTDAVAGGEVLVSLTTTGVIGLAALGFGVGMVVAWLRK